MSFVMLPAKLRISQHVCLMLHYSLFRHFIPFCISIFIKAAYQKQRSAGRPAYRALLRYFASYVDCLQHNSIYSTVILSQRGHENNGILSLAGNLYSLSDPDLRTFKKRNLPATVKNVGPLRFRYRQVSLYYSGLRETLQQSPLGVSTVWRRTVQCQQAVWPCGHSSSRQCDHVEIVPAGSVTMWTQCQQAVWPCGHSGSRQYDHVDTVSAGSVTIWTQCQQAVWPYGHRHYPTEQKLIFSSHKRSLGKP
jgi:hypothetical protein